MKELIVIAIFAPIGALILVVAGYYIRRAMRGSIKLALPRTTFQPNEAIVGSFDLLVKKPTQGNKLTVGLIGEKHSQALGEDNFQEVTATKQSSRMRVRISPATKPRTISSSRPQTGASRIRRPGRL